MNRYRPLKEIAADIRRQLKIALPGWEFSVQVKDGLSITVALMKGPRLVGPEYAQLNHYYPDTWDLTPAGKIVMGKANEIMAGHHWDESNSQIDYFCCNFYRHLHIGKWNQPYQVKGKA